MASTIYDNKKNAIDERYHIELTKAEDVYKKNVYECKYKNRQ